GFPRGDRRSERNLALGFLFGRPDADLVGGSASSPHLGVGELLRGGLAELRPVLLTDRHAPLGICRLGGPPETSCDPCWRHSTWPCAPLRTRPANIHLYCVWLDTHGWLTAGVPRPSESPSSPLARVGPTTPKHPPG